MDSLSFWPSNPFILLKSIIFHNAVARHGVKKHTKRAKRIRIKMHFRRYLTRRKTLSFLEKQRRKVKHPPLKAPTTSFYHWPACAFYQRHFRMKRSNKGLRKYRSVLLGLQTDKSAYSNIKAIMSLHSSLFGRRSKKADFVWTPSSRP